MMEADVQGDYQAMSVSVNKRLFWSSRRKTKSRQRLRRRFEAVHRHHNERAGLSKSSSCVYVTNKTRWKSTAHPHQFAEEK